MLEREREMLERAREREMLERERERVARKSERERESVVTSAFLPSYFLPLSPYFTVIATYLNW